MHISILHLSNLSLQNPENDCTSLLRNAHGGNYGNMWALDHNCSRFGSRRKYDPIPNMECDLLVLVEDRNAQPIVEVSELPADDGNVARPVLLDNVDDENKFVC